ncbi:MAG TPA: response regulator transcription factor [Ktedonobacteraceae bacterium]|jgi:DNA-binding response OmpR family regulator|nr:response regulator transcription factor [Ktedonobacteraceae bacterium]
MPAKKMTILTADDDPQLQKLVKRNLERADYDVLTASNGQEALTLVKQQAPDVVLLDVTMPNMDGFEVCRRIRTFSNVPILMLTARDADQDKVQGLDLGADDYLTKPFSIDELLARVRAVLRRAQLAAPEQGQPGTAATVGKVTLDHDQHKVTREGRAIDLTPTEYRMLIYFMQNVGRVVTQDMLLENVWGPTYVGEGHMLQVNINRLRRKIEPDPNHPRYILTKVGVGYLFNAQPEQA